MATLPNDPRVIHKTRKRFNGAVRNDRDASERSKVDEDPLIAPVNGHLVRLTHATVLKQ